MQNNKAQYTLTALLVVMFAVIGVKAGGPLAMWNTEQRIPYRYNVTTSVPVYTDLGLFAAANAFRNLPEVTNERGDEIVAFALAQWTNVDTSSFQAHVAGDFASIGLPDANSAATALLVLDAFNGGGIHVIYDHNGAIMQSVFGAPPSTLGVASPEWADEATGTITESWVVINGTGRQTGDPIATHYAGVVTHEVGHSINLAHTQTNGAIIFSADGKGPSGCATVPYSTTVTTSQTETMYPFIAPQTNASGTGQHQSTVDLAEDKVAVSNLYPSPDYASTHGSISGRVLTADGSGITGINVIARNIANPYSDAISAMSGDYVRVPAGDDGTFTINGLTPGAQYALYTDSILSPGSFPTTAPFYTPGPEDFYNGANEGGDGLTDDRCQAEPLVAIAGSTVNADITLNAIKGAPKFTPMALNTVPTSITSDGSVIGGAIFGSGVFRYTEADGYEVVSTTPAISPKMSRDGSFFTADRQLGSDRVTTQAALLPHGATWERLPLPIPSPPVITAPCDTTSHGYGVASGGQAVAGSVWVDTNGSEPGQGCRLWPFHWTPQDGSRILQVPAETPNSRPNNMSDDGSTVVGWYQKPNNGFRFGSRWVNGVFLEFSTPDLQVSEAYNATPNGSAIVGADAGPTRLAWRWTAAGGIQMLGRLAPNNSSIASAVSDNGNIVAGRAGQNDIFVATSGAAFVWTPELGLVSLDQFVKSQGTFLDRWNLNTVTSMSSDGTRMVGSGAGPFGTGGWILDLDKINVCHAPPGKPANAHTINVSFVDTMADHLNHGDTIGFCIDSQ